MLGCQPHVARSRRTRAKRNAIGAMLSAIVVFAHSTTYAQLQQDFPVTNSQVSAMVVDSSSGTMYIGGWFDYAGPNTGNSVVLDTTTGKYDPTFPKANGTVSVSAPDGKGGWYIGGRFTKVGKVYRNSLAHIRSDGSVDDWNPNVMVVSSGSLIAGWVYSIVLLDSTVYFGGSFTQVGGTVRNMAAAVNVATGLSTAWNPDADNTVKAIIATSSTIYLGGGFQFLQATSSSKVSRGGLASVDPLTGVPTTWDPGTDGVVNCLLLSGTTMYVGGYFSMLGGSYRYAIGAVNTGTGMATLWNPNYGNTFYKQQVSTFDLSGNTMYVGGIFAKMGTQFRNNLAAVSLSGRGSVLPWNPNVSFVIRGTSSAPSGIAVPGVYSIAASGSNVYVGGFFNRAGSAVRRNLAAFDTSAGAVTAWNPNASLAVLALKKSGTALYAGGEFTSVNGFTRYNLAAIDLKTKTVNAWDPSTNEPVEALALYGSKILIGGYFDTIGTQNTAALAAVDKKTGAVDPWTLNSVFPGGGVGRLSVYKDRLYIGGWFYAMGDSVRSGIAAIDLLTGKVLPWYPGVLRTPHSFAPTDSLIYICGSFGLDPNPPPSDPVPVIRHGLGVVDAKTGAPSSWGPFRSTTVYTSPEKLYLKDKALYLLGSNLPLDSTGTTSAPILKLDVATGKTIPFDLKFQPNSPPYYCAYVGDIAIVDSTFYAVGGFSSAGGVPRQNIASFDVSTGAVRPWNPNLDGYASIVSVDPSRKTVYVSGGFSHIDDDPASFLAAYTDTSLGKITTAVNSLEQQPREFSLDQNYPNPFNPSTNIEFRIANAGFVSLKVYDMLGREVATLVNEQKPAGIYQVTFDASHLPSGVYFARLESGSNSMTRKLVLMK